jgi:hypothetical protein
MNQVTSMSRILLEKMISPQLVKKFLAFYEALKFITLSMALFLPEFNESNPKPPIIFT